MERRGVIGVWDSMRGWSVWCPLLWSEVHHWHHPSAQPPLWQPAQVLARPAANPAAATATAAAEWKNAVAPPTLCHLHPSLAKTPRQKPSSQQRTFIYFFLEGRGLCSFLFVCFLWSYFLTERNIKQLLKAAKLRSTNTGTLEGECKG